MHENPLNFLFSVNSMSERHDSTSRLSEKDITHAHSHFKPNVDILVRFHFAIGLHRSKQRSV